MGSNEALRLVRGFIACAVITNEVLDPMFPRRIKRVSALCQYLLKVVSQPSEEIMRWEDDGGWVP